MVTLIRAWGLHLAGAVALTAGVVGAALWVDDFAVPQIRLPVPMPLLFPALTTVLLAWFLVERWQVQLTTSVRPPWLVPTARFVFTQLLSVLAALVATTGEGQVVWLHCSLGASLAAVLTIVLGRMATMALLLCGYLWLYLATQHPVVVAADPTVPTAIALVASGALYVGCAARRQTP